MSITFELALTCDNDAFEPTDSECDAEVARILRAVATKVVAGEYHLPYGMRSFTQTLFDANGNEVGRATYRNTPS